MNMERVIFGIVLTFAVLRFTSAKDKKLTLGHRTVSPPEGNANILKSNTVDKQIKDEVYSESCDPLIQEFSRAASNFTNCTLSYSIPPKICTECGVEFFDMQLAYDDLRNKSHYDEKRKKACVDVIFSGFAQSFVFEVYNSLKKNVWEPAMCTNCIKYNIVDGVLNVTETAHARTYNEKLDIYRACIEKFGHEKACNKCSSDYQVLYTFYWDVFVSKELDFCLDIEAAMNETISHWRDGMKCRLPPRESRENQVFMVSFLSVVILLVTLIFYLGSFIQGERRQRKLLKYSRLHHNSSVTEPSTENRPLVDTTNEGYGSIQ